MVNQKTFNKFKPLIIMKKLFFTALAVVAFSGVSMASTVEVKERVLLSNEIKIELQKKVVEEDSNCYDRAMDIMDKMTDLSPVEAYEIWLVLTENC